MAPADEPKPTIEKKIVIRKDGPYCVSSGVPLVRKTQVVSELGEPITWKKEGRIECEGEYALCRCGQSANKPFCDGTHHRIEFDGTESANTSPRSTSHFSLPSSRKILVEMYPSLCTFSGFCGLANTTLPELLIHTDDTQIRSLVIAMIERCPSGALTHRIDPTQPIIEPDLPEQIATTIEIISGGPIVGPLWVTGGIPIERSDSKPFETRNRLTLCNCGKSRNKPLCDGRHRAIPQPIAGTDRNTTGH